MDVIALRDLLIRWAEINSGSSNIPGLKRMQAALAAEFSTLPHVAVETIPLAGTDAPALRVRLRPEAPKQVLLSGHFDTVYDAAHPFQKCTLLEPDMLRGPGVADMKGGIVVLLAALREFERTAGAQRLGFEVLLTPDEETGSEASRPLLEATAQSRRHALALVFEPARGNGDLVRTRKGVGVFTLTCHGRAAHAGRDPALGRNAILALAEYLPKAAQIGREFEGLIANVGTIRGGGPVNIVPDFAEAQLNVRISRVADATRVADRLRELAEPINAREGYQLVVTGGFDRPPKEVTPTEERLFLAWQQCAQARGVTLSWQDVGGGSDGNLLGAAGLPCLDGVGPVGDNLHSPDEFIRVGTLVERATICADFLGRVSRGEIAG